MMYSPLPPRVGLSLSMGKNIWYEYRPAHTFGFPSAWNFYNPIVVERYLKKSFNPKMQTEDEDGEFKLQQLNKHDLERVASWNEQYFPPVNAIAGLLKNREMPPGRDECYEMLENLYGLHDALGRDMYQDFLDKTGIFKNCAIGLVESGVEIPFLWMDGKILKKRG